MGEELTLHEAALRLYDYGPRIEMASTEKELIRLCDERDKLLSFFRKADASRASPTPPTTEGRPDIVARLRNDGSSWAQDLFNEAAEEIDRLRKAAP